MGEFSGIDPEALLGTTKSFTADKHGLRQSVNAIKTQFQQLGLDTSPLNELIGQCGWLDDRLPGLNRRLNLAAAMDHDRSKDHRMIQVPEPVISASKAQADGKALAQKYAEDKSGDPLHDFAAQLAAHRDDPDFCSAFYANLPAGVAVKIPSLLKAAHDPTMAADLKTYSEAFGTAVSGAFPAPGFDTVEKRSSRPCPRTAARRRRRTPPTDINGGPVTANLLVDETPVAGEVVMVGTGVCLAGDFLYHHWKPFHDVSNDVGHATVTAAKDVGHGAKSAWHKVSSSVGSWF